jgi:hypothetical protein
MGRARGKNSAFIASTNRFLSRRASAAGRIERLAWPHKRPLVAARGLAGLEQQEVKLDPATVYRKENCGDKPVRGHAANVEAVVAVLRKAGVEITEDGARLIKRPRR